MTAHRYEMPTRTEEERGFLERLEDAARASQTTNVERFSSFPVWAPRQSIARFLAQYQLYQEIVGLHGSIIEGGVAFGSGLMAWAHLASILEPVNHTRKIVGFDTFSGFPGMAKEDAGSVKEFAFSGGMAAPVFEELQTLAALHDTNRSIGHIPRVTLVKGNACETVPKYVKDNPSLVVAALVLDFDIYEPTEIALTYLLPRMSPGALVIFDEVGVTDWPGETLAYLKHKHKLGTLQRSPLTSTLSWAKVL